MSSQEASETKASTPVKKDGEKPLFTEKEERLLKVAMAHCLKSGPPEIDIQKFMTHGEFNTLKTAQNTWGKIKAKLTQAAGSTKAENGAELDDGEEGNGTPKTPKTPKTGGAKTPASKKRGKKAADDAEGENGETADADGSPKKKRKSPVKKTPEKGKAEEDDAEGEVKMENEE